MNDGTGTEGATSIGVWGEANAASGIGVLGESAAGFGIRGSSATGIAIFGETTDPEGGIGVFGNSPTRAVVGTQGSTSCAGTYGVGGCSVDDTGVFGRGPVRGIVGTQGDTSCEGTYGVGGCATGGIGVFGRSGTRAIVGTQGDTSCAGTYAVGGCATTGQGMFGRADLGIGVFGNSNARGIVGTLGATSCAGTYAVGGCAVNGDGVVARSDFGRAGFFQGNVVITGSLTKGSGAFKIDHPVDPENKYLSHSFVESPEMLTVYAGNVVLDAQGRATVTLPDWFEALNADFRYQLTAIGFPGPELHVADEITNNRFTIAGGRPGKKVSWQVTGVRRDPFAVQNPIRVEEWKTAAEQGKYLHPAAYGKGPERGVHAVSTPDADLSTVQTSESAPRAADQRAVKRD